MPKPQQIAELETMARTMVGDSKSPNLYFVTDQGVVTLVTRDIKIGHKAWSDLARRSPRIECALEDRKTGVLASVSPESDEPEARLLVCDDVPTRLLV